MTFLLILGSLFIALMLFNRQKLVHSVNPNSFIVRKISNLKWFQNEWLSGIFLFLLNALLFGLAVLTIFLSGLLSIPFLHLVIMLVATLISLYVWIAIHHTGNKGRKERLIMSAIGSSFYLFLLLTCLYMLVNLEPSTPENDTFMAAIGLVFAMFVSFVALITCFFITGFSMKQLNLKN